MLIQRKTMKTFITILLLLVFSKVYSQAPSWEWARTTIGSGIGHGAQECYSIASDQFGNVYLSGYFSDSSLIIGPDTLRNYGASNVFIAKYDSSGNVLWAKQSLGAGDNEGNGIAMDSLGNSYVT